LNSKSPPAIFSYEIYNLHRIDSFTKNERGRKRYPTPNEIESKIRTADLELILSPDSLKSTKLNGY
jgi:hypothetical protein